MNEKTNPPQVSLLLRLLGGGYLLYLAWDLRGSLGDSPLFLIAVIVFAVVGVILVGHSGLTLLRHEYFRNPEPPQTEESEENSHE